VYEDIRDKLEWGGLYFYYGEKTVSPDTIVTKMYPITVEEIHSGTIKGPERIITLHPGVYGWPEDKDRRLHLVHRYDGRGVSVPHDFLTGVDATGVRTEVRLDEGEAAVLEPIPVRIDSAKPVNVAVPQYSGEGVRLIIAAEAACTLTCRTGAFPLTPGQACTVTVDGAAQELPVSGDPFRFSFAPPAFADGRPVEVAIEPVS
jgi:hypothetical protein